jgi:hypothetical protein
MKLGCIITNRSVKLRVWLGNARHHPWLRNSKVNHQPVRICLHFYRIWKMRFWFISLQRVKQLTVRFPYVSPNERRSERKKIFILWSHWRGVKLVKDATRKLFSWRNWRTCETPEPVRWNWVILVSFLFIYNKCASFFENCLYFLTHPRYVTVIYPSSSNISFT